MNFHALGLNDLIMFVTMERGGGCWCFVHCIHVCVTVCSCNIRFYSVLGVSSN